MQRKPLLAMSGRAVEAAGDVDTLLLDKTGTITLGNRQAAEIIPAAGADAREVARIAYLSSLPDETPEGRSIVTLAGKSGIGETLPPGATFVPFSAYTRMSGVDLADGTAIRKGASRCGDRVGPRNGRGARCAACEPCRAHCALRWNAATPCAQCERARRHLPQGYSSSLICASGSTVCARWAFAR